MIEDGPVYNVFEMIRQAQFRPVRSVEGEVMVQKIKTKVPKLAMTVSAQQEALTRRCMSRLASTLRQVFWPLTTEKDRLKRPCPQTARVRAQTTLGLNPYYGRNIFTLYGDAGFK